MKRDKKKWVGMAGAFLLAALLAGCSPQKDGAVSQKVDQLQEEVQKKLTGDDVLQAESVSDGKYIYETLDDETKTVYDELVYIFQNRLESAQIATTDEQVMKEAYHAVRCDYSEFFWVEQLGYVTYTRNDQITAIEVTPVYTMSEEEQQKIQAQIDEKVDAILADAPTEGSDFDKALYVYNTLIETVDYVPEAENNQNIISVFLNEETVCQGYAYGTQYLLNELGISCTTVTGTANDSTHAWNLVSLDGAYYYMDTTWGNSQYIYATEDDEEAVGEEDLNKYINYDYFGVTTETLFQTHTPDNQFVLPECTATADNYFVHEGCYVYHWDADEIGGIIAKAYDSGEDMVQIKFDDTELCEQAIEYFLEESHLLDYCQGIEQIDYMENSESDILYLLF